MDTNEDKPKRRQGWTLIIGVIAFTMALCVAYYCWVPKPSTGTLEQYSQWGESFGPLNVLFSAFAFAALFCALMFQREELELQREELRLTRKELKASGEAQRDSAEALKHQANVLRSTTALNALIARISVYDLEITEAQQLVNQVAHHGATTDPEVLRRREHLKELKIGRYALRETLDQFLKGIDPRPDNSLPIGALQDPEGTTPTAATVHGPNK
jgi:hypothetical protein